MGGFYSSAPQQEEGSRWRPVAIAIFIIVVVVAIVWAVSRKTTTAPAAQPTVSPYANNLQISDLKLATAENFVGGSVTYIYGTLTNSGDKNVTGARVQVLFRNSLGEIVQQEPVAVRVETKNFGQTDYVPLASMPLAPGQKREFRLTFDHISDDWDRGYPEMRVIDVQTK
jgi:hypothetical protein